MKKTILFLSLFIFQFLSCINTFGNYFSSEKLINTRHQKETDTIYRNLTPVQADSLIQANTGNPDFIIIDVRTPAEFNNGYIEGAINIDYLAANFSALIDTLNRNKRYFVYCGSGFRSAKARDTMHVKQFVEVYNLIGGTSAWVSAGYTLVMPTNTTEIQNNVIVNVYPNPVNNLSLLEIYGTEQNNSVIEIYDIFGRLVKNYFLKNENKIVIDKNQFAAGVYLYRLTGGSIIFGTGKFEVN